MSVVTRSMCWEGCREHCQYRSSVGGQARRKRTCEAAHTYPLPVCSAGQGDAALSLPGNLVTAPGLCPLYAVTACAGN